MHLSLLSFPPISSHQNRIDNDLQWRLNSNPITHNTIFNLSTPTHLTIHQRCTKPSLQPSHAAIIIAITTPAPHGGDCNTTSPVDVSSSHKRATKVVARAAIVEKYTTQWTRVEISIRSTGFSLVECEGDSTWYLSIPLLTVLSGNKRDLMLSNVRIRTWSYTFQTMWGR